MQARLKLDNQRLVGKPRDHARPDGRADHAVLDPRRRTGRLRWVNRAYAAAVEASTPDAAVREGKELLGTQAREAIDRQHLTKPVFDQSLSTVIDGDRRVFAVTDFAGAKARPASPSTRARSKPIRAEYERTVRSHADTLDQLTTAVAIFDEQREAALLQPGVPETLGARPRLPRQRAGQCAADRQAAQRGQDRRAAGMAALEGEPALRLPLGRVAGALVAPAGRPHHPRRRQPAAQGRRHLGVREPDREDGSRKPLRHGGARAGRDARQSGRRRRRVRAGRPHPPVQPGLQHAVAAFATTSSRRRRISRTSGRAASRWRRTAPGRASSPRSPASTRSAATATARPNWSNGTVLRYARRSTCPTAR